MVATPPANIAERSLKIMGFSPFVLQVLLGQAPP